MLHTPAQTSTGAAPQHENHSDDRQLLQCGLQDSCRYMSNTECVLLLFFCFHFNLSFAVPCSMPLPLSSLYDLKSKTHPASTISLISHPVVNSDIRRSEELSLQKPPDDALNKKKKKEKNAREDIWDIDLLSGTSEAAGIQRKAKMFYNHVLKGTFWFQNIIPNSVPIN